jgi:hypothetical protein
MDLLIEAFMSEFWVEILTIGTAALVMIGVCAFEGWSR